MSKVAISGNASGSGTFTIASPNGNTDRTLTLPDNTGTLITNVSGSVSQSMLAAGVAGNGPLLFSGAAPGITIPNVTNTVWTTYNASVFDTANAFSTSTGRYNPQVAGYYLAIATAGYDSNGINASSFSASVFKNGTPFEYFGMGSSGSIYPRPSCTTLVYLNGTTDYIQAGTYQNSGGSVSGVYGRLQAVLVRAA